MKILDALFGRSAPQKPKLDALFALATAQVTMQTSMHLVPGGRAGLAFRGAESSLFESVERELQQLLQVGGAETNTRYRMEKDSYGFTWVVLEDPELEDLIATVHTFSSTMAEQGFGGQLLAAAFRFEEDGRPIYWVYSYKRGTFYPFVPSGQRRRDNAQELRLKAMTQNELPIEGQLEQWYALWDLPV